MSFKLMLMVFKISKKDITLSERMVLLRMSEFASCDGGSIFPSISTIEDSTSICRRIICKSIKSLISKGVLSKVSDGGGLHTNVYKINIIELERLCKSKITLKNEPNLTYQQTYTQNDSEWSTPPNFSYPHPLTKVTPPPNESAYDPVIEPINLTCQIICQENNVHARPPSKCEIEQREGVPSIDASVDKFSSKLADIKKNKKTKKKNTPKTSLLDENRKSVSISDQFNRFWASYPRKVGRSACEKVFARVIRQTPLLELLNAISAQTAERDKKISSGLWVPEQCHPRTWLNQGRWLDNVMTDEELKSKAKQNMASKISYRDMKNIQQGIESELSMRKTKFVNDNNLSCEDLKELEAKGFDLDFHVSNLKSKSDAKSINYLNSNSLPWSE